MANGLPDLKDLKKKPLPESSQLKKKESSEGMESPSPSAGFGFSLGSPRKNIERLSSSAEETTTEIIQPSVLDVAKEARQKSFNEYVNKALKDGYFTVEELSQEGFNPYEAVAKKKLEQNRAQDMQGWGPTQFRQGANTVDVLTDEDLVKSNMDDEIKSEQEKVKEQIISSIPEEERTPEKLEEVEEELWQNLDMQVDLTGEGRFGTGKGFMGNVVAPLQKGTEDMLLSTMATLAEGREALGIPDVPMAGGIMMPTEDIRGTRKQRMDELAKRMTQYRGDILDNLMQGNFSNAGGLALQQTGESLPLMLAAGMGNPAASFLALSGLSANKHYQDVREETWFKDLNTAEQLGYLAGYGGAEGLDLVIGGMIIKNAAKSVNGKNGLSARTFLQDFFKGMGYDVGEEALSEGVTGVAQYALDQAAQGKDITMKGLEDAFVRNSVAGAAGAPIMRGVGVTSGYVKESIPQLVKNTPEFLKVAKQEKELLENVKEASTPEEVEILSAKAEEVAETKSKLFESQKELLDKMTSTDLEAYSQAVSDINTIQKQLENVDDKSPAVEIGREKMADALGRVMDIKAKYQGGLDLEKRVLNFFDENVVSSKIENNENINESEIESYQNELLSLLDESSDLGLDYLSELIEDEFNKAEEYDKKTRTITEEVTEKRPVGPPKRIVKFKEETKGKRIDGLLENSEVTTRGQLEGERTVIELNEKGNIQLVRFSESGQRQDTETLDTGKKPNEVEYVSSNLDSDGNVESVTLRINEPKGQQESPVEFTIIKRNVEDERPLDIAINAAKRNLGAVPSVEFQQAYETITQKVTKEVPINQEEDAIQERSTEEVPVGEQTEVSEGVLIEDPEGGEATTEGQTQEQAKEGGEIVDESNPISAIQAVKESVPKGTFGQQVAEALKPFTKKGGKVTNNQAQTLSKRAANVKTQAQLDKFIEYATKVLENSEFEAEARTAKKKAKSANNKLNKGLLGADAGQTRRALKVNPEELSNEELNRYTNMVGRMNSNTYSPFNPQNIEDIKFFADKYERPEPKEKKEQGEKAKERKDNAVTEFKSVVSQSQDADTDVSAIQDDIDLMDSLTDEELDAMDATDVERLTQYLSDSKEGIVSIDSRDATILRRVRNQRGQEQVKSSIEGKGFKNLLRSYFNPKNLLRGKKGKKERIKQMIRNMPLNRLDSIVRGAMDKSKPLYKTLIQPISKAYSKYEGEYKTFEKSLNKFYKAATKGLNGKTKQKVSVKLALIGLAKQKAMNPDASELSTVEKYMENIVEDGKGFNDYKDLADLYEEVYNELKGKDATLDWQKAYDNLSRAEKEAFTFLENHYAKQASKVAVASARNGEGTIIYDYYNPIKVKYTGKKDSFDEIVAEANKFGSDNVPKSPNLNTRKSSDGELIFLDAFGNAESSNRSVLRDYYLREPLRDASNILKGLKKDKDIKGDSRDFVDALDETIKEVTKNVFINTELQGNNFIEFLRSRGYERDLVSIPRALTELVSNAIHAAIYAPKDMKAGAEFWAKNNKKDLMDVATKLGTTQFSRLFQGEGTVRAESGSMNNRPTGWWDRQLKSLSGTALSLPDKAIAQPLWLGAFARQFKKETGQDFDVDKFLDDPSYGREFKKELDSARDAADNKLSQGFATMNPFEGIVASQIRKDENLVKTADKYMTRFVRFEFQSAVDAINGMLGRNEISQREAIQLLAATTLRMAAYQAGLFTLQNTMFGLIEAGLGIDGEREEEDMEKILKRAKMSFLSTGLGLVALRRLGNLARIPIVGAVELLNYMEGEKLGLRDKPEYDSFEDSLLYSPAVSAFRIGADYRDWYTGAVDFMSSFAGPLNKLIKSLGRLVQDLYKGGVVDPTNPDEYLIEPDLKTKSKIENRQERATLDALNIITSTFGIPFGRDLVNMYSREVFEEYANKDKKKKKTSNNLSL